MKWVRTAIAAAVLTGFGLSFGCSKSQPTTASAPTGAPAPEDEIRPVPTKMGGQATKGKTINP
jgi:hypothetical protein